MLAVGLAYLQLIVSLDECRVDDGPVVGDDPLGAHLVKAYEWVAVLDGHDALGGVADVPYELRGTDGFIEDGAQIV